MRYCNKCGVSELNFDFVSNKNICKKCRSDYDKNRYLNNKENRLKQIHEHYVKNKDKIVNRTYNYKKQRMSVDSLFKMRQKLSISIRKSLNKIKSIKDVSVLDIIGCSINEFMAYLGPKPEGDYHLDHICPCAQAQNEEELIKLQHYTNFRWLKATDNLIKSDEWTLEGEEMCIKLLSRSWVKIH